MKSSLMSRGDIHIPRAPAWALASLAKLQSALGACANRYRKLDAMLARLDPPRRRNLADDWLRHGIREAPTWMVQCVLARREEFGTVTVVTTSCHGASDEDEAKFCGMRSAARGRADYKMDLVTAKPVDPP